MTANRVHAPYATVIVIVSRGLAERTASDSHPLTEKVPNLCRPAPAVMSSPLTALDAAENFASQIRAFSGGRGFRKGDAGLAEDAEVQFPGYGERVFQSANAASICWSAWVTGHSVAVHRCLNASELFPVIRAKPKCVVVWQSVHRHMSRPPDLGHAQPCRGATEQTNAARYAGGARIGRPAGGWKRMSGS